MATISPQKTPIHAVFNMTKMQKYTTGKYHFFDLADTLDGIPGWEKDDIVVSIHSASVGLYAQYYSNAIGYKNEYIQAMDNVDHINPSLLGFCVFNLQTRIYQCYDSDQFTEVDFSVSVNHLEASSPNDGPILE